jgi:hypothetical protein
LPMPPASFYTKPFVSRRFGNLRFIVFAAYFAF